MKIKAVEAVCRSENHIYLIGRGDDQWIGSNGAIYPLHGFPEMNEDNVFAWLGIPEKKRKGFTFTRIPEYIKEYDFGDVSDGERPILRGNITINTSSRSLEPLRTTVGVVFLDKAYLKPFGDGATFFERKSASGRVYIAIKEGLLLKGIILPSMMEEQFTYELLEIARLTRTAKDFIITRDGE